MDTPLVSLIATFYNVEEYACRCVESLVCQDYVNCEILLIDDGSTDSTRSILARFEGDERVRIIAKENGGAADARNHGVALARGEFVSFVDGDDYVSPRYLSCMVDCMVRFGCNLVVSKHRIVGPDSESGFDADRLDFNAWQLSGEEATHELLYNRLDESPWAKLARRELYVAHPFPTGRHYEDVAIAGKHYLSADKVGIVDAPVYAYRMRLGSVVHKKHATVRQAEDFLWAINEFLDSIAKDMPGESSALAYRYSLEYSRLHSLLANMNRNDARVIELDSFALGEIATLLDIVLKDGEVPHQDKIRLFLQSKTPEVYDVLFRAYEAFFKGVAR